MLSEQWRLILLTPEIWHDRSGTVFINSLPVFVLLFEDGGDIYFVAERTEQGHAITYFLFR